MEFQTQCLFFLQGVIGVVDNLEKNSSRIKLLVGNDISSQHLTLKIEDKTQSIFALLIGFDDKTGEFRLLQIGDSVDIKKGLLFQQVGSVNIRPVIYLLVRYLP